MTSPRVLKCLWFSLLTIVLIGGGCERYDPSSLTAEVDETSYRRGKELLKQGRDQEALAAFLKVIEKRGDDRSPESHLEVGILYQQHIKDPIAAIYHYRKYRELMPNSPQAELVRQRIDAATREFARSLPAQPLDNQMQRLDLLDRIEQLQHENTQLKDQLVAARTAAVNRSDNIDTTPAARPVVSDAALITPAPLESQPPAPAVTVTAPAPNPANASAGAGQKTHTVVKGDTLYNLAQKYYNNQSRWRDIYAANRNVMRSENDLKIGMQLVIP